MGTGNLRSSPQKPQGLTSPSRRHEACNAEQALENYRKSKTSKNCHQSCITMLIAIITTSNMRELIHHHHRRHHHHDHNHHSHPHPHEFVLIIIIIISISSSISSSSIVISIVIIMFLSSLRSGYFASSSQYHIPTLLHLLRPPHKKMLGISLVRRRLCCRLWGQVPNTTNREHDHIIQLL